MPRAARWTSGWLPDVLLMTTRYPIVLLALAAFASMAVQRICDAMLPELSRDFGVELATAAQVVSVFAVFYGGAQFLHGPLGDHYGKFRVVTWAVLACGGANLLAALAQDLQSLLIARVLAAVAAAAIIPLSLAWIGDRVDYANRQLTLARFGLGVSLGITGGQLAGGLLTDTLGWRWAFVALAVLMGLVGLMLWITDRNQIISSAAGATVNGSLASSFGSVLGSGWSLLVLAVTFVEGAMGFGVSALWATHLHKSLGVSLAAAGTLAAMFGVGGMLYMLAAGKLIHYLGERGLVLAGGGLFAAGVIVLGQTPGLLRAPFASALAGAGFFMFHNTLQVHATQMAPQARGTSLALFASALFLGQSAGVTLGAESLRWIGANHVIALSGGIMLLAAVSFAWALGVRKAQ